MSLARRPWLLRRSLPGISTAARAVSFSPPSTAAVLSPPVDQDKRDGGAGVLDLEDPEKLFASTPTGTLLRSLAKQYVMACDPVVDLGIAVTRSKLVERGGVARAVVMAAVKETVYSHFCAGEDVEEAGRTLQALWNQGLRGILDYSLEDAEDTAGCDANLAEFLNAVEVTSRLPPSSVSFACVKISAICPAALLERVSDLLRWEERDPSTALPWRRHSLPVLSTSSPFHLTPAAPPPPLTGTEERDLQLAHRRLSALCAKCAGSNVPLLVDAECVSVQPAIDYLTFAAAIKFNRGKRDPVVFGTIQAYLKDSKDRLVLAMEAAERAGIPMGFKLVRGAYMTTESRVAAALGAPSPIHSSIQETHACYDRCAFFMLEKVARGSASVVLATHNLDSGKAATAKVEELGIGKGNQSVQFAQLKGMAEGLSLGLRNAGFNVSKYLPYGPVDKVIPYLVRRAEENRGLLSASALERVLVRQELKRRLAWALLPGRRPPIVARRSVSVSTLAGAIPSASTATDRSRRKPEVSPGGAKASIS